MCRMPLESAAVIPPAGRLRYLSLICKALDSRLSTGSAATSVCDLCAREFPTLETRQEHQHNVHHRILAEHAAPYKPDGNVEAHMAELQDCYERLQKVPEAVAMMEEFGVEMAEDLKELEQEDIQQIAKPLKKVPKNKLFRVLGFS